MITLKIIHILIKFSLFRNTFHRLYKVRSFSGKTALVHTTQQHPKQNKCSPVILTDIKIFWNVFLMQNNALDIVSLIFNRKLEMDLSRIKCQYLYLIEQALGKKIHKRVQKVLMQGF